MYKDVKIEQETLDILKADDTLNRVYVNPQRTSRSLPVHRVLQDPAFRADAPLA